MGEHVGERERPQPIAEPAHEPAEIAGEGLRMARDVHDPFRPRRGERAKGLLGSGPGRIEEEPVHPGREMGGEGAGAVEVGGVELRPLQAIQPRVLTGALDEPRIALDADGRDPPRRDREGEVADPTRRGRAPAPRA